VEHRGCGSRGRGLQFRGKNWPRGYKVYRHGVVTGFVPALDRRAVREISARLLSQEERVEIADLCRAAWASGESPSSWAGLR
jgi:hypothetical protein